MKILYFGDIIGTKGMNALGSFLRGYLPEHPADFVFANGENVAGGRGITKKHFQELKSLGIDGVTTGNHVFDKREIYSQLKEVPEIIRPLNYPPGTPGMGYHVFEKRGLKVGLLNLHGRVFMNNLDCPFRRGEEALRVLNEKASVILVDFHGEATSEKKALGYYLDGRVTAVLGTHTHVQTNDPQLLPKGTFYLTDLGMVGAQTSILGVKREVILNHFLTGLPFRVEVEDQGTAIINGVELDIDDAGRVSSHRLINLEV